MRMSLQEGEVVMLSPFRKEKCGAGASPLPYPAADTTTRTPQQGYTEFQDGEVCVDPTPAPVAQQEVCEV